MTSKRRLAPHELDSYRVGSLPTIFYIPHYLSLQDQLGLLHQINAVSSTKWKSLKNRRLQNWGGVVHEKGLLPQPLPLWLSDLTGNVCEDLGLYPSPINHVLINEYLPGQGIMPHQDGPAYYPVVAILSLGSPAIMQFTPHQSLLDKRGDPGGAPGLLHEAESVILMPGSLLVFKDAAYQDYLHGIEETVEHRVDNSTVNVSEVQLQSSEDPFHFQLPGDVPTSVSMEVDGSQVDGLLAHEKDDNTKDFFGVVNRNGTRISLTCRLVPKVHRNLFKF